MAREAPPTPPRTYPLPEDVRHRSEGIDAHVRPRPSAYGSLPADRAPCYPWPALANAAEATLLRSAATPSQPPQLGRIVEDVSPPASARTRILRCSAPRVRRTPAHRPPLSRRYTLLASQPQHVREVLTERLGEGCLRIEGGIVALLRLVTSKDDY